MKKVRIVDLDIGDFNVEFILGEVAEVVRECDLDDDEGHKLIEVRFSDEVIKKIEEVGNENLEGDVYVVYECQTEPVEQEMGRVKVLFAKLREDAIIPSKRDEDAGADLYPVFDESHIVVMPGETHLFATGLCSVIPGGYYAQFQERGSTGSKGIKFGAGVIDSGFRSEWFIPITNCNKFPLIVTDLTVNNLAKELFTEEEIGEMAMEIGATYDECFAQICKSIKEKTILYPKSKAIAQYVLLPVPPQEIVETTPDVISSYGSERGNGALGSSGK